ncbi:MAG: MOSC domain-containing protein [Arcobacter sp.]|nr:MOSC domain-containing protein [Arcobacter sp.]
MNERKTQNKYGDIIKLFISDKETKNKIEVKNITLEIGGIVNDKSFGKPNREILITSLDSYEIMKYHDIVADFGALGENILVNFNPYHLEIGTQLKCGDVILEISMYCPVCNHLSELKSNLPKLIKNDRGIFAKVVQGGNIEVGSKIFVI